MFIPFLSFSFLRRFFLFTEEKKAAKNKISSLWIQKEVVEGAPAAALAADVDAHGEGT